MSVKKEASGRRYVQVEVEVPGTPEEVWQAIATGPGISSWFVPTEFEERDGKPVAVKLNFGPGMESRSAVTAWDPPRRFAAEAPGWAPGSPRERDGQTPGDAGSGYRGALPVGDGAGGFQQRTRRGHHEIGFEVPRSIRPRRPRASPGNRGAPSAAEI